MTSNIIGEKREHSRVNDTCIFKYHELISDLKHSKVDTGADFSIEELIRIFFKNDNQNYYHACKFIDEQDREVTVSKGMESFAEANQRKIMMLLNLMFPAFKEGRDKINLSGGGLGFKSNREVGQNSRAYVMLILSSQIVPLFIKGTFVYCFESQNGTYDYKIGFQFD